VSALFLFIKVLWNNYFNINNLYTIKVKKVWKKCDVLFIIIYVRKIYRRSLTYV